MSTGKKILCVDDDELSRLIMLKFIEHGKASYSGVGVANGESCLSFLSQNKVDLILMDYNLGDMNGADVCKLIPSTSLNPDVPVIIVSVFDKQDLEFFGDYPNVIKVVQKPYYINNFNQDLADVLGA